MTRRRHFVEGLSIGDTAAILGGFIKPAWALAGTGQPRVLSGTEYDLDIADLPVNYTGPACLATAVNGQVLGSLLRWREGTTVTLRVTNRLRVPSSIHWHGLLSPAGMDGVPGSSFPGIAPGESFVYRFPVRQSGTYGCYSLPVSRSKRGCMGRW